MNRLLLIFLVILLVAIAAIFLFGDFAVPHDISKASANGSDTETVGALAGEEDGVENVELDQSSSKLSRAEVDQRNASNRNAAAALASSQIDVRLVDSQGKPIADATLEVTQEESSRFRGFRAESFGPRSKRLYSASGTTDRNGYIRLSVRAGIALRVEARGEFWAPVHHSLAPLAPAEVVDLGSLTLTAGDRLVGRVLDPQGKAIAGAPVGLEESGSSIMRGSAVTRHTKTDADGNFAIAGLPTGRYRIQSSPDGYQPAELNPLVVPGTGRVVEANLHVSVGRVVRGTVVDLDGNAIVGAVVSPPFRMDGLGLGMAFFAEEEGEVEGTTADAPARRFPGSVLTDASGNFQIGGLSDKDTALLINADGYSMVRSMIPAAGEELLVRLQPRLSVSGTLLRPNGKPAAEVEMILKSDNLDFGDYLYDPIKGARTTTNADGEFVFRNLSADLYHLTAYQSDAQLDAHPLPVVENVSGLILKMNAAQHLIVSVTSAAGKALGDAAVKAMPAGNEEDLGVTLLSIDNSDSETQVGIGASDVVEAKTDSSGIAILPGVPQGGRRLKVEAEGYADGFLDFVRNNGEQRLELSLQAAATLRVSVKTTTGRVLSGVEVYLEPQFDGAEELSQASGAAGRVVWNDLHPGLYEIGYRESGSALIGMMFISADEQVEEDSGNHKVNTVELVGRSTLEFEIVVDDMALATVQVNRNGAPAGGVQVWLESDDPMAGMLSGMNTERPVVTGADGVAMLSPKEPGAYTLIARAGNNAPQVRKEVELHSGEESLAIEVLGAEVTGTLFANGEVIAGASVSLSASTEAGVDGDEPKVRVGMVMMVGSNGGGGFSMESGNPRDAIAVSDGDGVFRFHDVPAGSWTVQAKASGYETWQSDSFAVGTGAEVNLGAHQLLLGASISGRNLAVKTAQTEGMFNSSSFLRLKTIDGKQVGMSMTEPDGGYAFKDLSPGEYIITRGAYESEALELSSGQQLKFNLPKE